MGKRLLILSLKSLKRRWREIVRACTATFLAVVFITGVLLFQENMYQWQMASNMERFGDWFIMDVSSPELNDYIKSHPYIEGYARATYMTQLFDDIHEESITYIGSMTDEFIKSGHIKAEMGRLPQNEGEIAMDYNTLSKMGYRAEVGQKVTVYYRSNMEDLTKEYELVGVLRNYTSLWKVGEQVPGAIVTQEEAESYNMAIRNIYIYSLNDSVRTDDYKLIFDNIKETSGRAIIYNENVYNYKPWGLPIVYNYMYILVMVIGITALTYQVIGYRTSRQEFNMKMRRMGATKGQINFITYMENMLILVPFGLLGIAGAGFLGKSICIWIEQKMQVNFYRVNNEVFIKALLSILIAIVVEEIVSLIYMIHNKNLAKAGKNSKSIEKAKAREKVKAEQAAKKAAKAKAPIIKLNKNNLNMVVHSRFMKTNGWFQNMAIRLFSLVVCVVVVVCLINVVTAYEANTVNENIPDIVGYRQEEDDYEYRYPFFMIGDKAGSMWGSLTWDYIVNTNFPHNKEEFREHFIEDNKFINFYEDKRIVYATAFIESSKFMKVGNTNLTKGLGESFINNLDTVSGIKSVSYSYFETQRMWLWDDMKFEKMGIDKLRIEREGMPNSTYGDRYWYATEYITPTEELYKKLSKYIDKEYLDYDAFCNGEQIVLFIDDNPNGEYDDTITAGEKIAYQYYDVPIFQGDNGNIRDTYEYYDEFVEAATGNLYDEQKAYDWLHAISMGGYDIFYNGETEYVEDFGELNFGSCVEPMVAGVVKLNSEIKEEFKDILLDYGYYTAIASTKMAEIACEKQNDLMADLLNVEELPENVKCKPLYNQLSVEFDLSSSYSATSNIVEVYCKESNIKYISNTEAKETIRTKTISALLQYGITMLAAMVINVLICAIVVQNRIAARRARLKSMALMGADKSRLCRICMIEAARESLWCIFTLPFVLLVELVLYWSAIRKL